MTGPPRAGGTRPRAWIKSVLALALAVGTGCSAGNRAATPATTSAAEPAEMAAPGEVSAPGDDPAQAATRAPRSEDSGDEDGGESWNSDEGDTSDAPDDTSPEDDD